MSERGVRRYEAAVVGLDNKGAGPANRSELRRCPAPSEPSFKQ